MKALFIIILSYPALLLSAEHFLILKQIFFQKAEDYRMYRFYPALLPEIVEYKEWPSGLWELSVCSEWRYHLTSGRCRPALQSGVCAFHQGAVQMLFHCSQCTWTQGTRADIRIGAAYYFYLIKGFLSVPVTWSSAFYKLWYPREECFHYAS